jgi:hypothetical protein
LLDRPDNPLAFLDRYKEIQLRLEGNLYPPIPRERVSRPSDKGPKAGKRVLYASPLNFPLIPPEERRPPKTPREALIYFAGKHSVTVDEILGKSRKTRIVRARREVAIWIDENWRWPSGKKRWSICELSRFLNRNHSSILHTLGRRTNRKPKQGIDNVEMTYEEKRIEAAAKALRDHEMTGRKTKPWDQIKGYQKDSWLLKAENILKAADAVTS